MRTALFVMAIVAAPALALHGQAVKAAALSHSTRQSPPGAAWDDGVSVPREAIRDAMTFLGVPYVSGGTTRRGLDCSGLIYRVLQDTAGMDVPRGVEALFHSGTPVTYPMHIGDLVFFDTETKGLPSVPCHVGIYAGRGRFIQAASEGSRTGVIVSPLDSPYYRERFLGARRIIPWRPPVLDVVLTDTPRELVTASPFPSREKMTIEVINRMTGGGPMDLTILKDGKKVLAARIAPGAFGPARIPLTPDAGTWDVLVNRLWKGRELERVTFTVEE
jgi:NlpC/P60 family